MCVCGHVTVSTTEEDLRGEGVEGEEEEQEEQEGGGGRRRKVCSGANAVNEEEEDLFKANAVN